MSIEWTDVENPRYTAEQTTVNGQTVVVCLDDEGPMTPCFYWDINDRQVEGWARSVTQARKDALTAARALKLG